MTKLSFGFHSGFMFSWFSVEVAGYAAWGDAARNVSVGWPREDTRPTGL
jgi:hypothetical protein